MKKNLSYPPLRRLIGLWPIPPKTTIILLFLCLFLSYTPRLPAQCGLCTLTQADLIASPGAFTIPAGQTLCITSNFCMGNTSNWPGSCSYTNVAQLTINGTLKICTNITFKFSGSIVGTGKVQIMSNARFSLYGTYDCSMGLAMSAVDPTISSGTSTSSLIGSCNSAACEPHFTNGYAPLGVVATGLGYTVNGACSAKGYPADFLLLPSTLTSWDARWQGKNILLEWSVANQQSSRYQVEYSTDAWQWQKVSGIIISARTGSSPQNYSYMASGPFAETNFFRLKTIQNDGSYQYSSIEKIAGPDQLSAAIVISPNPVQSSFTLRQEGPVAVAGLQLIDIAGKILLQLPCNPAGQYHLDKLAPGTYFLEVLLADGSKTVKKLIKR